MRRIEALVAVVAALLCICASATWLLGPVGLGLFGVALLAVVLFVFKIKE